MVRIVEMTWNITGYMDELGAGGSFESRRVKRTFENRGGGA